jgi:hypothetical protein
MLPAGGRTATSWVHYTTNCNTQSIAPEDGQKNFPKHVELIGIINKPLLLLLVGCLYYDNLILKFLNLLFQVSSNGDPLCELRLPLHTHWNAVRRNPVMFSLRFRSLFSYLPAGEKYFYSCVYIIQVNK